MVSPVSDHGKTGAEDLEELRASLFPSEQRRPGGIFGGFITVATVGLCLITLYQGFWVTFGDIVQNALHLVVAIPLTLLLYPAFAGARTRARPQATDVMLAVAAIGAFGWAIFSADRFQSRMPFVGEILTVDLVFGAAMLITVLEATRRTIGLSVVIINLVFIVYALTGPYWPGLFQHRGVEFVEFIENIYMLPSGIFNFIMQIMATFIFAFLALGAFLRVCGGDKIFTNFALALAGHRRGGPAKVAIIASALMGTLSGSTVSNVVTTGSLTIPMMKRIGFRPHEAAAIETTASLGGALTPPLMGAGVFVMAEFTGVPVLTIMAYSVVPAVLYFLALYCYADVKARKLGILGLDKSELPDPIAVLKRGGHIFLPLAVLIVLLVLKFSPYLAATASVFATIAVSWLRSSTRITPSKMIVGFEGATKLVLTVSALGASAALIYSVITMTGLIVKITAIILATASGSLFVAVVLIALMSYVLGMGLPVTAAYVLIAALGANALSELGTSILAAHLIIFWFSQDSTITPPVAMTAFVAARIADAPPMKTGFQCVVMAKALYIIPFVFAFGSLLDESVWEILVDFGMLALTFVLLPVAVEGHYNRPLSLPERALVTAAAIVTFVASIGSYAEAYYWIAAGLLLSTAAFGVVWKTPAAKNAKPDSRPFTP